MMISPDSASFVEKKRVENRLWRKSEFLWRKKNKTYATVFLCLLPHPAIPRRVKSPGEFNVVIERQVCR